MPKTFDVVARIEAVAKQFGTKPSCDQIAKAVVQVAPKIASGKKVGQPQYLSAKHVHASLIFSEAMQCGFGVNDTLGNIVQLFGLQDSTKATGQSAMDKAESAVKIGSKLLAQAGYGDAATIGTVTTVDNDKVNDLFATAPTSDDEESEEN